MPKEKNQLDKIKELIAGCDDRPAIVGILLADLFCAIQDNDLMEIVLTKEGGIIKVGKDVLEPAKARELGSEARLIKSLDVYKKLVSSLKTTACEKLYLQSRTADDMIFGKAMLYAIDVLEKKLENIAKIG